MAFLRDERLAHLNITCFLSQVRQLHIARDLGDPFIASMPKLEQVLRRVKGLQGVLAQRPRLPITLTVLRALRRLWSPRAGEFRITMMWAACCLGFFGFLRAEEFTLASNEKFDSDRHLSVEGATIDSVTAPALIRVRLKQSKTDPFQKLVDIFLGRTHRDLCPVSSMLGYLARRDSSPGPLFRLKDGKPLSRLHLVEELRDALSSVGIQVDCYSGHSFRIGAATTAAGRGMKDSTIQTLNLWKSNACKR